MNRSLHSKVLPLLALLSLVFLLVDFSAAQRRSLTQEERRMVDLVGRLSFPIYAEFVYRQFGFDPTSGDWAHPPLDLRFPAGSGSRSGTLSGPLYWVRVNSDSDLDAETTMTTVKINVGGTDLDHTALGYMKYWTDPSDGLKKWRTYVSAKKGEEAVWTTKQLNFLQGYARYVDPVLHANVSADGQRPKRVYMAGLIDIAYPLVPQAITVAYSDNGGIEDPFDPAKQWSVPVEVEKNISGTYYLDKPDLEVSWHAGTRGHVYVSYTKLHNQNRNLTTINFSRSQFGGELGTWSTPVPVVTGDVQASQVVVNPFTGRVYCIWTDYVADAIKMAYSDNFGASWSVPETAASGPLKTDQNQRLNDQNGQLSAGTPSRTIPQARFDSVNNRLIVTWHECEYKITGSHSGPANSASLIDSTKNFSSLGVKVGDFVKNTTDNAFAFVTAIRTTTNPFDTLDLAQWDGPGPIADFDPGDQYFLKAAATDIYYTAKYTSTQWLAKVKLSVPLANDQFQPAIDFNTSGVLAVGYYDRSADPNNRLYELRWITFDRDGILIASGQLPFDPFQSDPTDNEAGGPYQGFMGDYTDTWFWTYSDSFGPRFHTIFCAGPGNGDIYLLGLQ